jgi:hypothetical protein
MATADTPDAAAAQPADHHPPTPPSPPSPPGGAGARTLLDAMQDAEQAVADAVRNMGASRGA